MEFSSKSRATLSDNGDCLTSLSNSGGRSRGPPGPPGPSGPPGPPRGPESGPKFPDGGGPAGPSRNCGGPPRSGGSRRSPNRPPANGGVRTAALRVLTRVFNSSSSCAKRFSRCS
ncbi:MAG: hypothetical protein EPO07_16560 [Verrucomicrobia bacterium]|nr:MAG: hypothetical protein EPO07_16560 [Verrucomicrobiota bacterium]